MTYIVWSEDKSWVRRSWYPSPTEHHCLRSSTEHPIARHRRPWNTTPVTYEPPIRQKAIDMKRVRNIKRTCVPTKQQRSVLALLCHRIEKTKTDAKNPSRCNPSPRAAHGACTRGFCRIREQGGLEYKALVSSRHTIVHTRPLGPASEICHSTNPCVTGVLADTARKTGTDAPTSTPSRDVASNDPSMMSYGPRTLGGYNCVLRSRDTELAHVIESCNSAYTSSSMCSLLLARESRSRG